MSFKNTHAHHTFITHIVVMRMYVEAEVSLTGTMSTNISPTNGYGKRIGKKLEHGKYSFTCLLQAKSRDI